MQHTQLIDFSLVTGKKSNKRCLIRTQSSWGKSMHTWRRTRKLYEEKAGTRVQIVTFLLRQQHQPPHIFHILQYIYRFQAWLHQCKIQYQSNLCTPKQILYFGLVDGTESARVSVCVLWWTGDLSSAILYVQWRPLNKLTKIMDEWMLWSTAATVCTVALCCSLSQHQ